MGNSFSTAPLYEIFVGLSVGNEANPPKSRCAGNIDASRSIPSDAKISNAHLLF